MPPRKPIPPTRVRHIPHPNFALLWKIPAASASGGGIDLRAMDLERKSVERHEVAVFVRGGVNCDKARLRPGALVLLPKGYVRFAFADSILGGALGDPGYTLVSLDDIGAEVFPEDAPIGVSGEYLATDLAYYKMYAERLFGGSTRVGIDGEPLCRIEVGLRRAAYSLVMARRQGADTEKVSERVRKILLRWVSADAALPHVLPNDGSAFLPTTGCSSNSLFSWCLWLPVRLRADLEAGLYATNPTTPPTLSDVVRLALYEATRRRSFSG